MFTSARHAYSIFLPCRPSSSPLFLSSLAPYKSGYTIAQSPTKTRLPSSRFKHANFSRSAFSLLIPSPRTKECGRYLQQTTWHCSTQSCEGTTPSSMTIMASPSPIPIDGIESNPITPFFHALRLARGKIIRCPPGQRYVVPSPSTTTQWVQDQGLGSS